MGRSRTRGSDPPVAVDFLAGDQYATDALGLRTSYDAGRVDLLSFDGDHLRFNQSFWDTVIAPYFAN